MNTTTPDNAPNSSICPECGAECGMGDKYCRQCGAQLGGVETAPAKSGPSTLPFSIQILILVGGLVVVAVLFFLFKGIKHEKTGQTQQQNAMPEGADPAQSPHEITNLPTDFAGLVAMGNSMMDAGGFPMATECYRRALMLDPNAFDVRVDFAICLHSVGMTGRAIEELRQVCIQHPEHSLAFFNAGIVFLEAHQPDSAKTYLNAYLQKFPNGSHVDDVRKVLQTLTN